MSLRLRHCFLFLLALPFDTIASDEPVATLGDRPAELRERYHRIPGDDIWWTVRGDQMAWMHRHVQQMFPTVPVYRDGAVRALERAPLPAIAEYPVEVPGGVQPLREFLEGEHAATLGLVVVHRGRIVFEQYPRMREFEKPIYWSVSKVFAGAIVRMLEERGDIDVDRPVAAYVTRLAGTPFGDIRVRDVLDHATGLDCGDEYDDRDSCYYQYSMSIGDGFRTADAPDNPYDFLVDLEVERLHPPGTHFSYSGVNNFVLMWLIEDVTGQPFHEVFSELIWGRIGAEADAGFIAYRYGIPLSHGGFFSTMRDLARFGLLYTPSFQEVANERVISSEHVRFLQSAGRPELLANTGVPVAGTEDAPEPAIRFNIYQWGAVYTNGAMVQGGWGGQGLVINPKSDTVAVFTGYFRENGDEVSLEPIVLKMLDELFVAE